MKRQRHLSVLVVLVLICVYPVLVACDAFSVGVERTFTEPAATVSLSTETVLSATSTVIVVKPTLTPVRAVTMYPTATPDISVPQTMWKTYTNRDFGVSLRYPGHWQPVQGEVKYVGNDGFFGLDAIGNPQATIDQIAADQAEHKLRPYGSQPTIEILDIQGQEARLILPSADANMSDQAMLIVRYPKPIQLGEPCQFLALYADQRHIRAIAGTVCFGGMSVSVSQLSFEFTTYRDDEAGFEFDHPRSWTLGHQEKQGRGYIVQLCEQSPDQPRMQITVMLWEPNDLDGFSSRHEQSWLDSGNAIVSREEWMLAGNHRAVQYLIEGRSGERDFVLLTTVGERYLLLSGSGDLNVLAEIARTVRFLDPTAKGAAEHPRETGVSADLVRAREALQAYFDLLHNGHYAEAVSYYGGGYEVLWEWNPTVAQDDHATLFKNGCEVNGLQCLAIKGIASEQEISAGEYRFTTEFVADDGGTFVREPSVERFDYTVKKVDGQFLVQELPVYVP